MIKGSSPTVPTRDSIVEDNRLSLKPNITLESAKKLYTYNEHPRTTLLLTSIDFLTTSNSIAGVYICNATKGSDSQEEMLNITVQCKDILHKLYTRPDLSLA